MDNRSIKYLKPMKLQETSLCFRNKGDYRVSHLLDEIGHVPGGVAKARFVSGLSLPRKIA